jgi:Fe-S oxidoreductase
MDAAASNILASLESRVGDILETCTACGDCVAVCPTPGVTATDVADPKAVAAGILDILKNDVGPEQASQFVTECCGSGSCLTVCEHGINPRFMMTMAKRALNANKPEGDRREAGKQSFKSMSRSVRVISRLQLPPEILERLSPSSHPAREVPPEVIFYTGCNMLKTPHIGLICLDILDKLGVSYEVYGGPSQCCGILQMRPGDTSNAARQAERTLERFSQSKTSTVLSWCPTCQIQFSEVMSPSADESISVDMTMFPNYLVSRLDDLKPFMTKRVEKKVGLHEYPGSPGVIDSVIKLLNVVPGLEYVDLGVRGIGYQITAVAHLPEFRREHIAASLDQAGEKGVTTLASIYHADHRELSPHEGHRPFEIINYMELIGESMGISRPDLFKRLKLMQDTDAILAEAKDLIDTHNLSLEEVREVVLKDMIGEQYLPPMTV